MLCLRSIITGRMPFVFLILFIFSWRYYPIIYRLATESLRLSSMCLNSMRSLGLMSVVSFCLMFMISSIIDSLGFSSSSIFYLNSDPAVFFIFSYYAFLSDFRISFGAKVRDFFKPIAYCYDTAFVMA